MHFCSAARGTGATCGRRWAESRGGMSRGAALCIPPEGCSPHLGEGRIPRRIQCLKFTSVEPSLRQPLTKPPRGKAGADRHVPVFFFLCISPDLSLLQLFPLPASVCPVGLCMAASRPTARQGLGNSVPSLGQGTARRDRVGCLRKDRWALSPQTKKYIFSTEHVK